MKKDSSIENILKDVIKNLGGKDRPTEEDVVLFWAGAAGEKAAKHSKPVMFKKSVLTVNVDDSSWLYELTTKKKEIIRNLEGSFGSKKVKEVRFRIGELKE